MKAINKSTIIALLAVLLIISPTNSASKVKASQSEDKINLPKVLIDNRLQSTAGLLSDPRSVSTGPYHACAITAAGGVKCWGSNEYGQLGDGTTENRPTPVEVVGLSSGIVAVSASEYFTCALTAAGGVSCWGEDPYRDGTYHDRTFPREIPGMTEGVTAISSGNDYVCAIMVTGVIKCWGDNSSGELGDGTIISRYSPEEVQGLSVGAAVISAGLTSTCALTVEGGVKCWGSNSNGQLGDQTTTDRNLPVDVFGLTSGIKAIDVGPRHACAVTTEGTVKCWGSNEYGQLGDSTTTNSATPVDVVNLMEDVVSVSAGNTHTCVLTVSGGVMCWGENFYGQLGDGTIDARLTPVEVIGLQSGVTSISAGDRYTCAVTEYSYKCWGWGDYGQLGFGTAPIFEVVRDAWGLTSGIQQISSGYYHSCALTTSGGVKCWGDNTYGQLGHGNDEVNPTPIDVTGLTGGVVAISSNGRHSCALMAAGDVKCWGDNGAGQLGDGTTTGRNYPVNVIGLEGRIISVATGESFTCALTDNGSVKCWGFNYSGQVGDGNEPINLIPVEIIGFPDPVVKISAGGGHVCGLTIKNEVYCLGWNEFGQLGNNSTTDSSTPVKVVNLSDQSQSISMGTAHSCALLNGGNVMCWGYNNIGQLGNGTDINSNVPVEVIGLNGGVTDISSGMISNCVALALGGAKCWGANPFGNLGDGTNELSLTPVDVVGLNDRLQSIKVGITHVCALTINGGVKCWGGLEYGAITLKIVTTPTDVTGLSSYPFNYFFPILMR